jgi:hypothetical protein
VHQIEPKLTAGALIRLNICTHYSRHARLQWPLTSARVLAHALLELSAHDRSATHDGH